MTLTVHGRRIGPVQVTGPHLDDVFADYARPRDVARLEHTARTTAGAQLLDQLTERAATQLDRVNTFLAQHTPTRTPAVSLDKAKEYK